VTQHPLHPQTLIRLTLHINESSINYLNYFHAPTHCDPIHVLAPRTAEASAALFLLSLPKNLFSSAHEKKGVKTQWISVMNYSAQQ
jgi:hypothetical protein